MNPLLEQFLVEARDFVDQIGQKLLLLEEIPGDEATIGEIFRLVHTLKGNAGLFDMPSLTSVAHAAEDLLDRVRDHTLEIDAELTDALLAAMDFVNRVLGEIEDHGTIPDHYATESSSIAHDLRGRLPVRSEDDLFEEALPVLDPPCDWLWLKAVDDEERLAVFDAAPDSGRFTAIRYRPEPECFFKGEDPLQLIRNVPGLLLFDIKTAEPWPELSMIDVYRCNLIFDAVSTATQEDIAHHFRYVREQVAIYELPSFALALPEGGDATDLGMVMPLLLEEGPARIEAGDHAGLAAAAAIVLDMVNPDHSAVAAVKWVERLARQRAPIGVIARLMEWMSIAEAQKTLINWHDFAGTSAGTPSATQANGRAPTTLSEEVLALVHDIAATQILLLSLPSRLKDAAGRVTSARNALSGLLAATGQEHQLPLLDAALETAVAGDKTALVEFIKRQFLGMESDSAPDSGEQTLSPPPIEPSLDVLQELAPSKVLGGSKRQAVSAAVVPAPVPELVPVAELAPADSEFRGAATKVEAGGAERGIRVLKVPQEKVDRLMDLIGEMVVAKNALPYLATRAEDHFGSRELSREIKAQYAIINRIAEEMQDGIMQVRMLPVGAVFQRFPRLVRDVARQLGKVVKLVVEGEETEADKNIVESLADPMIHILRNSLDHGIEMPDVRRASGKPDEGRLTVRASQEGDRVIIEVEDDGKGIDPQVIKRKAFEKGLIDEQRLETISDADAVQLVFAPGFSTAEQVSNLSGRGVGMDVVKASLEKVGGQVRLTSEKGEGTRIQLSLPLSMSVSHVMTVTINGQHYGVPMEAVVETVRVAAEDIHAFKQQRTAVLRGRMVPLYDANMMLCVGESVQPSKDGEYAVLVVRVAGQTAGIIVDGFAQTIDVILKPLEGPLAHLPGFSGSALLGDGSVLLVLNLKELI